MLDGPLSRCVARPGKDESEVVTDGGEDGIGCVAGEPKTRCHLLMLWTAVCTENLIR
jgi:hypothetical protein